MRNKKFSVFLIFVLLFACKTRDGIVERRNEGGVEVVLNKQAPYEIKGVPSTFTLERLYSIDTEDEDVAERGLVDAAFFDADSKGNVYFLGPVSGENLIFKFDQRGEFLFSFGRTGQGPGEIQQGRSIQITQNDNIVVTNGGNNRMSIFFEDGSLKEELATDSNVNASALLPNGNILLFENFVDVSQDFLMQNPLMLYSPDFESIRELGRQMVPNPMRGESLKGTWHIFSWSVSAGEIFTGFQENGYEISVYDFDGRLVRKIKKDFKPVPVPDTHKKEFRQAFSNPIFDDIRNKIYFPAFMPPFLSFLTDERGGLFVMTYELGANSGEYVFDIFTPEGIFVGRKNLHVMSDENGIYAKIKNGRLYSLVEKDSGYKELIVSQMIWGDER